MPRAFSGASTFSSTVSQGNSAKLWNTIDDIHFASAESACSCQYTSPPKASTSPVSMRSSVDLPDPDGPSSATISPCTDRQVRRRDHLDTVLARLGVVLLHVLGANDRFSHRQTSKRKIFYDLFHLNSLSGGRLPATSRAQPASELEAYDTRNPRWLSTFRRYHGSALGDQDGCGAAQERKQ